MVTDPSDRELLNVVENLLRDLVRDVLLNEFGEDWPSHLPIPTKTLRRWRADVAKERQSAAGRVGDDRLLYQANFGDLSTIILDPTLWAYFDGCFDDRETLAVFLERLRRFRNRLSHGRDLVPFETELVHGMAGQIRQEIKMFRSSGAGGPEPQHFARIDEVTDSFGNRASVGPDGNGFCETRLTLRPGDTLKFTCSASHPRNRGVRWRVGPLHLPDEVVAVSTARFTWSITLEDKHVHQQCDFRFELSSAEPPRAQGHCDGFVDFRYAVLPQPRR